MSHALFSLQNKVALITGGSGGTGCAICIELAERPMRLTMK